MNKFTVALLTIFISLITLNANACTDFRVTAKDGSIIIARSMEYAVDMQANVRNSNRGRLFSTMTATGKPALSWKAKYGYIFLDAFNVDVALDGMNEKGLSIEALYLPGLAEYQTAPAGHDKQTLPYINFCNWVLSNFDSVDQVREALAKIYVVTQKVPGMGDMVFPLHFAIYDASGKSIVVEYVGGKLNIHDNQIGVLTNSPTYDWHITNLVNYVHLTPQNPSSIIDNGVTFAATGQGFGMVGMPGDISPPSRFVKIATIMRVVMPVDNATGALNLAEHVINNVDIPLGLVRDPQNGKVYNETTQWVVFKDLTDKVFYYRTYGNTTLRSISLAKINFAENAPRFKMPVASSQFVQDMTGQFLSSPQ